MSSKTISLPRRKGAEKGNTEKVRGISAPVPGSKLLGSLGDSSAPSHLGGKV